MLPFFDRVIYPQLDRRGYKLTLRTRIIIGMFFSAVAVVVAGGVESYRRTINVVHVQYIGAYEIEKCLCVCECVRVRVRVCVWVGGC